MRRTLSQIGSVNPFAVEEHRELSGRLEELTTQDADLQRAIAGTEELIAQPDADITERFNAAFAAIGERFDDFCRLLFAGGSASLQLGDGDDGEAPAASRSSSVRPASGCNGWRCCPAGAGADRRGTAVRDAEREPGPVLHPGRGRRGARRGEHRPLRRRAAEARPRTIDFVVITHNRATIEVADTIYGVTMDDAAVSAVVSLRLADIPVEVPSDAAAPAREPTGDGLPWPRRGLGAPPPVALLGAGPRRAPRTWDEVEEALIAADIGAEPLMALVERARERSPWRRRGDDAPILATEMRERLQVSSGPSSWGAPAVILVVGVNGTGKTTTIAKLARRLHGDGHSVILAAATPSGGRDRAAAIWGDQLGVPVIAQRAGRRSGRGGLRRGGGSRVARHRGGDRRHRRPAAEQGQQLMAELAKIRRVIERRLPDQPRDVLLVLDATTGQNGLVQAEAFSREAGVTGIAHQAGWQRQGRRGGRRRGSARACRSSSPAWGRSWTTSPPSTPRPTWSGSSALSRLIARWLAARP